MNWDTAARHSIGEAMIAVNEAFWAPKPHKPWFLFGGCLFWVLAFWAVGLFYLAKMAVWVTIMLVLLLCLVAVVSVGGCWRGYRKLRHRPVPKLI